MKLFLQILLIVTSVFLVVAVLLHRGRAGVPLDPAAAVEACAAEAEATPNRLGRVRGRE